jgi:hypothetical protein
VTGVQPAGPNPLVFDDDHAKTSGKQACTSGPGYRGWFRPLGRGHRWRQVATGPGYRECWRALLDAKLGSGELIVLAEGKKP